MADMSLYNADDGFSEALLRGLRSGFLKDAGECVPLILRYVLRKLTILF